MSVLLGETKNPNEVTEEDTSIFPVFCINLLSSTKRRVRMINRFARAGFVSEHIHFINATRHDSGLVDYYVEGTEPWNDNVEQWRKDMACFASHLLAVRAFLASGSDYGFICEDDILFQNDFRSDFHDIYDEMPEGFPLLSFSYMATQDFDLDSANSPLYCEYPHNAVWGAQFYMISKDYAKEVISKFDRPLRELTQYGHLSSEIILSESSGYLLIRPLVIEDCISSDRRSVDNPYHMKHYCFWRWNNFSDSDVEKESPLIHVSIDKSWSIYGTLFPGVFHGKPPQPLSVLELQAEIHELTSLMN
jgi:GR25 family glycosyltransferase involved in LPS biosynthesis